VHRGLPTASSASRRFRPLLIVLALGSLFALWPGAQTTGALSPALSGFDQLLDTQVRDGLVYYRALKAGRGPLDRYVAALANERLEPMTREERIAFWLNAYNAIVLQGVIDHYPIEPLTDRYPARSVRQIPGWGRTAYAVAGRQLTLDQIEETELTAFGDPRVFLALGRGAVGSGRLRSEVYTGENLERQLSAVAFECATRDECLRIDRGADLVLISAIFSWREREFAARYAATADATFARRSPLERAVLALVGPALYDAERELLRRNRFRIDYLPFDWTLNEL
jgi:hypothetical protein